MVYEHSELAMQENFTLVKEWHINELPSMLIPRKAWQEDSMYPGPQYLTPRSNPQVVPRGMTEETAPARETEAIFYTRRPSNGEVTLQLGNSI